MPEWCSPASAVSRVLALASGEDAANSRPITILIEGPSGSGKSSFAVALVAAWPDVPHPTLVRLDDIYPGWSGLDAASGAVASSLLAPRAVGLDGGWEGWDWAASVPTDWHVVSASEPLILEGCGALSRAAAPLAGVRVWIEATDAVRRPRALARDAGAFDAHWEQWDAQWRRYVAREHPSSHADVFVRGD